jgi:ABC-type multidrug transport system ATPase subunit
VRANALEDINFAVVPGAIHGLVGHNGAGKTTLLLLAAGLLRPVGGSVDYGTVPATEISGTGSVGLLTANIGLFPQFTVRETLTIFARLVSGQKVNDAVAEAASRLTICGQMDSRIGALSTGLRKRAMLAAVLIAEPDLLLLDEPFAGLDPPSVEAITEIAREHAASGRTVIIASHDLPELQTVVTP